MKNVIQSYFIYFLLGISFNFIRQILFIITLNIIIIFHIFVEKKKPTILIYIKFSYHIYVIKFFKTYSHEVKHKRKTR